MAKIMIDATSLIRKTTGIEYYTLQIVKNLIKYDNVNEYIILFKEKIHSELESFHRENVKFLICSSNSQIYCEQIWIPKIIKKENPDVVHFPAFPPGMLVKGNNIIFTLHDATMWKYKDTLSWKNKLYMKPLSEIAIKKSKLIFTVSNDSKKNIIEFFPKYKEKVVVTGESISEKFKKINIESSIKSVRDKFKIGDNRYILSVCSLEPRKNILTLLDSYNYLKKNYDYNNTKLVLVGRKAWGNNAIEDKIKDLNLSNDVIITDYVSDEDLIVLYNGAQCFVYPSFYEGFGLPVLEAIACEIPVITSQTSSMPEVGGDAALLVDPYDYLDIAKKINRVMQDEELRIKMKLSTNKQLKKYNWKDIILKMVNLYTVN